MSLKTFRQRSGLTGLGEARNLARDGETEPLGELGVQSGGTVAARTSQC